LGILADEGQVARYTLHNLESVHDIHYSWTGWPLRGSKFPDEPSGLVVVLAEALQADGLSLESHTWSAGAIQLTVRAHPDQAPIWVSGRLKGRLDYALRKHAKAASFSRKVSLRAIGHNRTTVVDRYVRDQLAHVDLADPRYRKMLASVALHDPSVNLADPAVSSHGRYWYNLHLVFVVAKRYRIGERAFLERLRQRILSSSGQQGCAVKRVSIMPDHMHVALRGNPARSPNEIAVGMQEASADLAGCVLWEHVFYVGTFGEYDKDAVARSRRACPGGE
jgi:REP element-mobilizing transposase RayT